MLAMSLLTECTIPMNNGCFSRSLIRGDFGTKCHKVLRNFSMVIDRFFFLVCHILCSGYLAEMFHVFRIFQGLIF